MGRGCRPTETFWLASGLFWVMCISIEPLEKADMIQRIHESVSVVLNIMSAPKILSDVSEIHWGQRIGYAKNVYRNTRLRRFKSQIPLKPCFQLLSVSVWLLQHFPHLGYLQSDIWGMVCANQHHADVTAGVAAKHARVGFGFLKPEQSGSLCTCSSLKYLKLYLVLLPLYNI